MSISKLSVSAKPFVLQYGNIVSWNVLSESLIDATANAVSSNPNVGLFSQSFLKKRSTYILECLERIIKKYRPIFCLQEVNDSYQESENLNHILKKFFQDRYYRVIDITFGTFDKIYPELGIMTAIPMQLYDIHSIEIKQIQVASPNCYICTQIQKKDSTKIINVINTHFPAKFSDITFMTKYTTTFKQYFHTMKNIIVCGDFNTTSDNPWYDELSQNLSSLKTSDNITTLSIQRRDRRKTHNDVFQGCIDHIFWSRPLKITLLESLPTPLSDISMLQQPTKQDSNIIPSPSNPSDHFPIIATIAISI